jgi:hypothetical protein
MTRGHGISYIIKRIGTIIWPVLIGDNALNYMSAVTVRLLTSLPAGLWFLPLRCGRGFPFCVLKATCPQISIDAIDPG